MRKFLALLLTIIFIVIAPLTFVLTTVKGKVLNPTTYRNLAEQHELYEHLVDTLLTRVVDNNQLSEEVKVQFLSREELANLIQSVLTKEWVYGQFEQALRTTFAWFRSDAPPDQFRITVAVGDLKGRASSILTTLIEQKIGQLPVCPSGVHPTFDGKKLPPCLPAGQQASDFLETQSFDINDVIAAVPDTLVIEPLKNANEQTRTNVLLGRDRFRLALLLISIGALVSILFFLLIVVLAATSGRSAIQWAAINLFFAGGILLAGSFYGEHALARFTPQLFGGGELPPDVTDPLRSMVLDFLTSLLHTIRIGGVVGTVLAVLLFPLSFMIEKTPSKKERTQKPKPTSKKPTIHEKIGLQ